ncbi:hypothetical protein MOQ_008145 [Trypanosoma cruzi marinkellei]|uniref:Uncharacterized protein n=1 Tax=Trypanosoma cruzi marinkellei TaxID=85056 RepID=K2LZQ9_TRYCR|nr:hypothetical protein MOQ_008145 [Trypanosoma cruzi marinkellei]
MVLVLLVMFLLLFLMVLLEMILVLLLLLVLDLQLFRVLFLLVLLDMVLVLLALLVLELIMLFRERFLVLLALLVRILVLWLQPFLALFLVLFPVQFLVQLVEIGPRRLTQSVLLHLEMVMEQQPQSLQHPMTRVSPDKKFCHKAEQGVKDLGTSPREIRTLWKTKRKMTIHKQTTHKDHQRLQLQNQNAVEMNCRKYQTQQRRG